MPNNRFLVPTSWLMQPSPSPVWKILHPPPPKFTWQASVRKLGSAWTSFLKFLEDMSLFCGATDTPILDFWWCLLWVSKPEWGLPYLSLAEAYMLHYTFPEIHLWCNTCWPLGGQHGSQAISSTYLQGIGGTRNQELSCHHSQCEIWQARRSTDWAIPARLSTWTYILN